MKKLGHITNEKIQQIRKKTPTGMFSTNKPNQEGFTPEQIRDAYTHALLDPKNSLVELINLLIDSLNNSGIITVVDNYPTNDIENYLGQTILVKSNNTIYKIDGNGNKEVININNQYKTFNEKKGIVYLKVRNPKYPEVLWASFTFEKDGIYYLKGQYIGSGLEDNYKIKLVDKTELDSLINEIKANTSPLVVIKDSEINNIDYYSLILNNSFYTENKTPLVLLQLVSSGSYLVAEKVEVTGSTMQLVFGQKVSTYANKVENKQYIVSLSVDKSKNNITSASFVTPTFDDYTNQVNNLAKSFKDVSVVRDDTSGTWTFTFTKSNGEKQVVSIDTPEEYIIDTSKEPYVKDDGVTLVITFVGGKKVEIDMSKVSKYYKFKNTESISLKIDSNNNVTAEIVDGGVTRAKLGADIVQEIDEIYNAITFNRVGLLKVGEYNEDSGMIAITWDTDILKSTTYNEETGVLSVTFR